MIEEVVELKKIEKYLEKRNLNNQYKKAKQFILEWKHDIVQLKHREPKIFWIMYFRINKQFRAFARLDETRLIVFKIDNHQ